MGWATGSELFSSVIRAVKPHVADVETRKAIYRPIFDAFSREDWDTEDECLGEDPAYDAIYAETFPDRDEE
ncbi:hypothetical protein Cp1R7AA1_008 [Mesorhizobium phage Cp1R7A-A1]|nr:hypothetical protein Cp1R7AA1_008 [Mesorhizobium phage Cp1R7A-A1]